METSFKSHKKMVRELLEITESLRMVPLSYKLQQSLQLQTEHSYKSLRLFVLDI